MTPDEANALLAAWEEAARAFDSWNHARLRELIDAMDPPGGSHAPGLARFYGRLLRAQLAIRDSEQAQALAWLDHAAEDLLALPGLPGDGVAADAAGAMRDDAVRPGRHALHLLALGEQAVASAYVWVCLLQVHGVGHRVEQAWAAANRTPKDTLGARQRARAAYLYASWCKLAGERARAMPWYRMAHDTALAAGLRQLALQATLGTAAAGQDEVQVQRLGTASGQADVSALLAQSRHALTAAAALEGEASPYLLTHLNLLRAQQVSEEAATTAPEAAHAIGAADNAAAAAAAPAALVALRARNNSPDMACTLGRAEAGARQRHGDPLGALAVVDETLTLAQSLGFLSREEALCELGADIARTAGMADREVAYLRQQRQLRVRMQCDDAMRRARLGTVLLATETAQRETAVAQARALQLQLDNRALAQQAELLAEAARRDPLTGLVNRRGFDRRLFLAWARAARRQRPLCLAFIDIDHFKRVNDNHGHPAGDAVLQQLAHLLQAQLRPGDLAARLGGEEFAVLFARARPEQALAACERLREAVQAHPWTLLVPGVALTVSLGLVQATAFASPADACAEADRRLYAAKRGGRNQVRSHAAPAPDR